MKILGGHAKGRNLRSGEKNPLVRPILARIKTQLFDILRPRMGGSRFLDLFAGTGAVGLEALSQGAKTASFVEQDRACAKLIEENIAHLGFKETARLFRMDVQGNLSVLPGPYDIIFMGPPYKDAMMNMLALVTPTLANIARHKLLAPNGIIIAQHHQREVPDPGTDWVLFRQEKHGDSRVSFFRAPEKAS